MILQILDDHGRPHVIPASRVVVLLDDGETPVAAAVQFAGGAVEVGQACDKAGRPDPNFGRMMAAHGMDRTLMWERALLKPLSDFRFDGRKA